MFIEQNSLHKFHDKFSFLIPKSTDVLALGVVAAPGLAAAAEPVRHRLLGVHQHLQEEAVRRRRNCSASTSTCTSGRPTPESSRASKKLVARPRLPTLCAGARRGRTVSDSDTDLTNQTKSPKT